MPRAMSFYVYTQLPICQMLKLCFRQMPIFRSYIIFREKKILSSNGFASGERERENRYFKLTSSYLLTYHVQTMVNIYVSEYILKFFLLSKHTISYGQFENKKMDIDKRAYK